MMLPDLNLSDETMKKCVKNLDCTKGKVAMMLNEEITTGFADLMGRFANRRLEFLWGPTGLLTSLNVPFQIIYYTPRSVVSNAQFHEILRYNIEFLEIEIGQHFAANLNEPASPKRLKPNVSDSLKKLKVVCNPYYDSLMSLLDDIKDRCPNLKALDVEITLSRADMSPISFISDADEIMENVLAVSEKIQAIVKKCRLLVSKLKISSELRLFYELGDEDEFSCDWIDRAKTLEFLKDSVHEDGDGRIGVIAVNFCQLDSKFSDDFLELDHSTKVFRLILE